MRKTKTFFKEYDDMLEQYIEDGVRIDIWTHLMRECIMKLCTPI